MATPSHTPMAATPGGGEGGGGGQPLSIFLFSYYQSVSRFFFLLYIVPFVELTLTDSAEDSVAVNDAWLSVLYLPNVAAAEWIVIWR
jgi:hypothetical protein